MQRTNHETGSAVQERELCAQARLLPVHYLELKALMMREGQTKGYISRQEARNFFRLEPSKAVRYSFGMSSTVAELGKHY